METAGERRLCLGLGHVFIALTLVLLVVVSFLGNTLVILSVLLYKRMRTFTNILLTSLASSDLLVGLVVMPLALLDLLHGHEWPFGRFLCGVWATSDVLLCTASILNLTAISLDRYFAITSPLRYSSTRSRKLAGGLLAAVWALSIVICSPPWFVADWALFGDYDRAVTQLNGTARPPRFVCGYSRSLAYRIYSAAGSFYLPFFIMLFVYWRIFRVANERELLLSKSSTMRFSNKKVQKNMMRAPFGIKALNFRTGGDSCPINRKNLTRIEGGADGSASASQGPATARHSLVGDEGSRLHSHNRIEMEYHSMIDLNGGQNSFAAEKVQPPMRKITAGDVEHLSEQARQRFTTATTPQNLVECANEYYNTQSKHARGSREKMVYMRERKALKTIGIVVSGFIICWLPFFVFYLVDVLAHADTDSPILAVIADLFLWLGYSNSVLNPIIYTFYNGDFRRCFRDLLQCGCMRRTRRSMSIRRLQQNTLF